jgi:hypothetical protein
MNESGEMNMGQAVACLYPDLDPATDYRVEDHGTGPVLVWLRPDMPAPSSADIARGNDLWMRGAYRERRRAAYPALGDQLDAIMAGMAAMSEAGIVLPAQTLAWLQDCRSVKAAYPKAG